MSKIWTLLPCLMMLCAPVEASDRLSERELLVSKLTPYGDRGQHMIEAVDRYAEKCQLAGSEMSILIYFGATPDGETIKERIEKAANQEQLKAAISMSECPRL